MKIWIKRILSLLILGGIIFTFIKLANTTQDIINEAPAYCDKPVIYLYPEKETNLDIVINDINFVSTYPEYKNKWNITAYPDGTLIDSNNREYNYLFWEGEASKLKIEIDEGFIIKKENYIEFLEDTLTKIGLTNKESADFITYWLPKMNEFPYCQISFQTDNYKKAVNIDYSINPDSELRVFAVFKGLEKPLEIFEQSLDYYNNFKRTGFTVVEWGGMFI